MSDIGPGVMFRSSVLVVALACAAAPASGQADSATVDTVAPGVVHRHLIVGQGPWTVHVVQVDLRQPGISIRAVHALDQLRGLETVSSMARRSNHADEKVVAAVNADFFNLRTGEDENNQVVEGEIWKGMTTTDVPGDSAHHVHSQFGVLGNGLPLFERFVFSGSILRPGGGRISLDAINRRSDPSSVVLYTSHFGASTPWDSTGATIEIKLRYLGTKADTSTYQVISYPLAGGTAQLNDGPVLSFPASAGRDGPPLRPPETVRIRTNLEPAPLGLRTVVGGWPRLVVHGRSIADTVNRTEGDFSRSFAGRNPRTGVGISRDSTTLFLVTVDGRQEGSDGMSLTEFADLMIRLGIYEGLNLDGGGSTTMVINGQLVNTPSDKEKGTGRSMERQVGNALLVVLHQ